MFKFVRGYNKVNWFHPNMPANSLTQTGPAVKLNHDMLENKFKIDIKNLLTSDKNSYRLLKIDKHFLRNTSFDLCDFRFKGKFRENSNISMRLGNFCGEDDQLDSVTSVSDRRLCSKMIYYPLVISLFVMSKEK
ncbi:hypothetical protein BpHYR1_015456 [Brachionus plicatilis]|uniref:Uncharacterized protein n=1 Tax=Brachionus plicatilis TaxID=10195 RepID=A0A3M7PUV6_BRAPC|nr:hypothetical protein BpHYR1_015456 [Brachionus plicatilis]